MCGWLLPPRSRYRIRLLPSRCRRLPSARSRSAPISAKDFRPGDTPGRAWGLPPHVGHLRPVRRPCSSWARARGPHLIAPVRTGVAGARYAARRAWSPNLIPAVSMAAAGNAKWPAQGGLRGDHQGSARRARVVGRRQVGPRSGCGTGDLALGALARGATRAQVDSGPGRPRRHERWPESAASTIVTLAVGDAAKVRSSHIDIVLSTASSAACGRRRHRQPRLCRSSTPSRFRLRDCRFSEPDAHGEPGPIPHRSSGLRVTHDWRRLTAGSGGRVSPRARRLVWHLAVYERPA